MIILCLLLIPLIFWVLKPLEKKSISNIDNLMLKLKREGFISDKIDEPEKKIMNNKQYWKPENFSQFIGQEKAKLQAQTLIKKAQRGMKAHVFVNGIKGHGKCHRKGTKILMYDGRWKNVEELNKNDYIMGTDSEKRKVLNVGQGYGEMYKIKSKYFSFVVNAEHILSLKNMFNNKILNISVLDFLELPKNEQNKYILYTSAIDFKYQKTPLSPYFLGLWLGDGTSSCNAITNTNIYIQNWLKKYSKKNKLLFNLTKFINRADRIIMSGGRGYKTNFNITAKLRKLNLLNNKHIPDIYKYNSRNMRMRLLAGLIDSDGWLNQRYNYEITSKWESFANDIKYLAQSLGFFCYIVPHYVKLPKWSKKRKYFRIRIIGDCSKIPVKIPYKKAKKNIINKNPMIYSYPRNNRIKIRKLHKKETYYGFELDGNHLYMIDNFVVNHNTTYVELISKELKADYIYRIGKQVDEKSLPSIIDEINQSKNEFIMFFIDEIDTMESENIKMLNPLIENFLWDNKPVNPFIFAGATINKHILVEKNPDTLDRIYTHINFERYNEKELAIILRQYQKNLFPYDLVEDKIVDIISVNCKYNPRTGIGLLEDYIVEQNIEKVLNNHNIVKNGLTKTDIRLLMVLNEAKKAIGAKALAMRIGMTEKEYITEFEPFLVEFGFINRIPSRIITELGKEVLSCVNL